VKILVRYDEEKPTGLLLGFENPDDLHFVRMVFQSVLHGRKPIVTKEENKDTLKMIVSKLGYTGN